MAIEHPVTVALVSDTHGYLCPEVLSVVARCDRVVHAGDICGKHILDALHRVNENVVAVAGNNDVPERWPEEERETVISLPRIAELDLPGGKLSVEHGHEHGWATPDLAGLRAAHPQSKMIVYGHTHQRMVDKTADPWIVNPGAAGKVRNNGGPSCLVLHASTECWEIEAFRFGPTN
jgi:putative phosphoesterase